MAGEDTRSPQLVGLEVTGRELESTRCRWSACLLPLLAASFLHVGMVVEAMAIEASDLIDRTAETGPKFTHFNGMSGELYFSENMGSGVALVDYDGDGDLDAYLVQGNMLGEKPIEEASLAPVHPLPLTDRLFRNDLVRGSDGVVTPRFVDVTARMGVETTGYGMGVATGDYDGDGWIDLYITNHGSNQMLRNNGDGTFSDVTAETGTDDRRWSASAAFLDFDRDGWLDLVVVNYVDFRVATHKPCVSEIGELNYCGPLAYNPEPDSLFRNRGDGTFEDVSRRSGLRTAFGSGLGVTAADFSGDGWLDIYVANDQVANQMWINQGDGTFSDEALFSGTALDGQGRPQASMGIVAGDLDGDGSEDLFMTHLDRETNTIYLNDGSGLFRDVSRTSGLGTPSFMFTGFGTALFDLDADGWLDLFVANGAVQELDSLRSQGDPYPLHQRNLFFRGAGEGRFEEISPQDLPILAISEVSRGVATGDVDQDGDVDLLMSNNAGPARLYLNGIGNEQSWLGLRVLRTPDRGEALGARVVVDRGAGANPLWQRVASDGSYASASDPRVWFGLGEADRVERLRILPLGASATEWRDVPIDRLLVVSATSGRRGP